MLGTVAAHFQEPIRPAPTTHLENFCLVRMSEDTGHQPTIISIVDPAKDGDVDVQVGANSEHPILRASRAVLFMNFDNFSWKEVTTGTLYIQGKQVHNHDFRA